MTGPFPTRRRAEEFDAALARPPTGQDEKLAGLLAVVRQLRAIPEPTPRADFVSDLRSRLLAEAETALLPRAARPLTSEEQRLVLPVRSPRDRRLATALGAAALVGATTSMAVASQTALPGESLYPVKRALENAQTGLAGDDTSKGRALLASASGRLDEVRDLARHGDPPSVSAVESTLESFTEQVGEASDVLLSAYEQTGDEAVIDDLRSFTGSSMDRLSAMESSLPPSARDDLVAAGQRLADIDRQASQICSTCGGGAATSIPPNLLSGAVASTGVTTVIIAASQDPDLLDPVRATDGKPRSPASAGPVSGQDITDVEVPDLEVPDPTTVTTPTPTGKDTGIGPGPKVDVKPPINEVTKLLTGDLSTPKPGPVADEVLTGVGTTVDGTVDELQGTLDSTTGSLLP